MDSRDRLANMWLLAVAAMSWGAVALLVTTHDPIENPAAGFIGAVLIGLALGLTAVPLIWLALFARQRRIAYRGDWTRAGRRGAWIGVVAALFIALKLDGALQLPIALFVLTMVGLAEVALSPRS